MGSSMGSGGKFDVVVLGAGPGGYAAAIRAAQKGKRVALVEKGEVGGTCLNRGCIPSKALIEGSRFLGELQKAPLFGVALQSSFDYRKLAAHKDQVVATMRRGLERLIASNKISLFQGRGTIQSRHEVKIEGAEQHHSIEGEFLVIATGSEPRPLAIAPFNGTTVHDSTSLLALRELPKSLLIVGGGVIGCEFASLYAALGVDVTIVEVMSRLLPNETPEVGETLRTAFEQQGIHVLTGVSVAQVHASRDLHSVLLSNGEKKNVAMLLIAVGRVLNTSGIGLEKIALPVLENGTIVVDPYMETEVRGVFAIGDIASKWWLAHVATHQGIVAAERLCGGSGKMETNAIPSVVFTTPEVATVGLSLEGARALGKRAEKRSFPFSALGKAHASGDPKGFAQLIVDPVTGELFGAQVVGHEAGTLIGEITLAIQGELTAASLAQTIHPHPTLTELWGELGMLTLGNPMSISPIKSQQ